MLSEIGQFQIIGYTFYNFTKNNIKKLCEFVHTLDISCVNFEAYTPMYIDNKNKCYRFIGGFLCIFDYNKRKKLSLANNPIGVGTEEQKLSVLKDCFRLMCLINYGKFDTDVFIFNKCFFELLNRNKLKHINNYCEEFIYATESLRRLDGHKYKSIRNAINRFEKNNFVFRVYDSKDACAIRELYSFWKSCYEKKIKDNDGYGERNGVNDEELFFRYIKYRNIFKIKIFVVFDGDRMIGCIGISRLCKNSSIILFEKCDNSYVGICEYLWIKSVREYDFYEYECDGDGGTKLRNGEHVSGLYSYKMRFNPIDVRDIYSFTMLKKNEAITNAFFGGDGIGK